VPLWAACVWGVDAPQTYARDSHARVVRGQVNTLNLLIAWWQVYSWQIYMERSQTICRSSEERQ
jgi:hypothetical protein